MVCDFCYEETEESGGHTYLVAPFTLEILAYPVGSIRVHFDESWLACEACHKLIEAGDREGLLKRALVLGDKSCKMIQDLFWLHLRH